MLCSGFQPCSRYSTSFPERIGLAWVGGNIALVIPVAGGVSAYNTTASVTTNAKMSHSSLQAMRLATCNRGFHVSK